jgi:hypothetical protein
MLADGKVLSAPTGFSPVLANPEHRAAVLALVPLQLTDTTT